MYNFKVKKSLGGENDFILVRILFFFYYIYLGGEVGGGVFLNGWINSFLLCYIYLVELFLDLNFFYFCLTI